jgi:hypothetical protein
LILCKHGFFGLVDVTVSTEQARNVPFFRRAILVPA